MINLRILNSNLLVSNLGLLDGQESARLVADCASGSASITVDSISGFAINKCILIGNFGDPNSEIIKTHAATAPTGSTITLAANTTKDHFSDTKITLINFDQVEFSRALTLTADKSVLTTASISADRTETAYSDLTNTTGYAFVRFKNSITSAFSAYSSGVSYSGHANNAIYGLVKRACSDTQVQIGGEFSTEELLLSDANDCQDAVTDFDWKFEIVKNDTSLTATSYENTFSLAGLTYELKYPGSVQGVKGAKFGSNPLGYIDNNEMDALYKSVKKTTVATQAEVGATSIVLSNTSELSEVGTVYINGLNIVYTANDKTTNTLSGIPDTDISVIIPVGSIVWQDINPGLPTKYTITIDNNIVFNCPVAADYDGYAIKLEYLKKLERFTDLSSTTEIPFTDIIPVFVKGKIEQRKRNFENAKDFQAQFDSALATKLAFYKLPSMESSTYYNF